MRKILLPLVVLALLAPACNNAKKSSTVSITGRIPAKVAGNVATIPVAVKGIKIVKADGDTTGKSGHFHVFIDRAPVQPGKTIPKEKGIVHTADMPIKLLGLTPGTHRIHIVLGNGAHERIHGEARLRGKFEVEGPAVHGTAPATLNKGEDLTVQLKSEGIKIVAPGAESSDEEAHYHVLVDPKDAPKAGAMEHDESYMTGESSVTIKNLAAGEHVIWVVLENKDHEAWDPAVMDKLTVTVS
jgi:hypothetical protein